MTTETQKNMENKIVMKILIASDEDSYKTLWIDGEKKFDSSDGNIDDVIRILNESYLNKKPETIEFKNYNLYEASTFDIPDHVSTSEELSQWYEELTGEELSDVF